MNTFQISALRQLGLSTLLGVINCCSQEAKILLICRSLVCPNLEYMPLQRGIRIGLRTKISNNSNEFNVVLPVLLKKDYRHTTSVTGLLDELGWLSLFERRKHSRLTVFIARQHTDARY